jgi:AcrR family transcriptional regulator
MNDECLDEAAGRKRPTVEERRNQILDAAEACAMLHGFHGSSMAEIAKAAGLSVGQIYRYFENKAAIIGALVSRDRAELGEKFAAVEAQTDDVLKACLDLSGDVIERALDPKSGGLMLEVLAESARNPEVMRIVCALEEEDREGAVRTFSRARRESWSDESFTARLEMMSVFMEGLRARSIFEPKVDRRLLAFLLGEAVRAMLTTDDPPEDWRPGAEG